jgi:hypothetical protein
MKTTRILLSALALVGTMASPVLSKDLCVQIDGGVYAGSLVVLKRVKLGPQQHGPVHGYLRRFSGSVGFTDADPLNGQAMVSSTGNLVVGLNWSLTAILADGDVTNLFVPATNQTITLACLAGADGKIGSLDSCPDTFVLNDHVASHVVPCKDVSPSLP